MAKKNAPLPPKKKKVLVPVALLRKPKKLSAVNRQKLVDALQDQRDGVVIRSYERTLGALAVALGGSYAEENEKLQGELAPIAAKLAELS